MNRPTELQHLDRHGPLRAQPGRKLALIDHNHLAAAGLRDDLFAQQCPAAAFDQIQLRIDLIRAIDRQINAGMVIQRRERNAEAACLLFDHS